MLNHKGFDLWADGYDKSVGLSDEANTYPFAGYKKVLAAIFQTVMQTPNASVLDIGFGTAVLTAKLYEQGCTIYGQDFSSRMIELASEKCRTRSYIRATLQRVWWSRCEIAAMIISSRPIRCTI